ncbi:MAG: histidine kinase [Bacteroidia bacterium]|nr:histidine kinase [Bacteroidia bacterium]
MKKNIIILSHLIFWLIVISVGLFPVITVEDPVKVHRALVDEAFLNPMVAIIFYIFYLWVAPKTLSRKKIGLFMLVFFVTVTLYTTLIMQFYPKLLYSIISPPEKPISMIRWYASSFTLHFMYALWGTMFRFTIDWFESNQKQKELEKQNITGELALLRSQINPHFLFNTLNNINSFVNRDPEVTSSGIIKLSEIMRYMLYDADVNKVLLDKEISYIKSYIDLQKLRLKDPNFVTFNIDGITEGMTIPPLLLVPFIENAFKHGKKNIESPGIIISLKVTGNILYFVCKNHILSADDNKQEQGGFGLKNIKRRLDLLYGKNYSLDILSENEVFIVKLTIRDYENQMYSD